MMQVKNTLQYKLQTQLTSTTNIDTVDILMLTGLFGYTQNLFKRGVHMAE